MGNISKLLSGLIYKLLTCILEYILLPVQTELITQTELLIQTNQTPIMGKYIFLKGNVLK